MDIMDIEQVKIQNFYTEIDENGTEVELKLIGELDMVNPGELLTPFFTSLHDVLRNQKIKNVTLNIQKLTFLNSSSIKVLLNWLLKIKTLKKEERYQIGLFYNKEITWQASAFKALTVFAGECFYLMDD